MKLEMLNWSEIILRLAIASLFGALIGLERERKDWSAGLRTHMMVCLGSCLIMMVSAYGFEEVLGKPGIGLDPSRVAAQVVSGIGFIGAGTILFLKQGAIRGLTTASGLWTVAAIGLAAGGGMYFAAGITTAIALIILWALQPLERVYAKKFRRKTLKIVTPSNIDDSDLLKNLWNNDRLKIQSFTLERINNEFVYLLKFNTTDLSKLESVINELKKNTQIKEIFWTS